METLTERLLPFVLVGVGSFVGGNLRYLLGRWVGSAVDTRFPLATFLINVGGSLVLGFVSGLVSQKAVPNADAVRLALGVGLCGGFTTFSTFEFETHALLEDGLWLTALANVLLSVVAGLVALRLGLVAAKAWF